MQADTTFEVEIEFCGQEQEVLAQKGPGYLADSLLMKAADALHHLVEGGASNSGPGKRKRSTHGNGPLQECDEVALADGTEVLLEPSGHGLPPRFSGEMPAALCKWLYSHAEPKEGRVVVMSEPASIGQERYPLFYFVGSVPASSVRLRD